MSKAKYKKWDGQRRQFLAGLASRHPEAVRRGWEKDYFKGSDGTGTPAPEHQSRIELKESERTRKPVCGIDFDYKSNPDDPDNGLEDSPSTSSNPRDDAQSPLPLHMYFEQVWVISLKRREDRLARFWREIEKANWPFRRPEVFPAVEGNKVGVPRFWQTGGASYGCL